MVYRVYVEKRDGFDIQARQLCDELKTLLNINSITRVRLVNRYDVDGISQELFQKVIPLVFSEPQVDIATEAMPDFGDAYVFATEFLPGQFDQRADSASECIQLISQGERPQVRTAKIIAVEGDLSEADINRIKSYVINPVESREALLDEKQSLDIPVRTPQPIERLTTFNELDDQGLQDFINQRGLAMDLADAKVCQAYFRSENRPPTITEIKVIDTYWSDHCRHTTFGTELDDVQIDDETVRQAFQRYLEMRNDLNRNAKPVTLMDMGTLGAKWLKANGVLTNVDESDEINACTVKVSVDVNGQDEDWLFLFKNETHNHPTEIEPFGGAATCIGGCIRDPLSGRSYVYQAMRVTGAADPRVPIEQTLEGKLPQRKLVTTAAAGYASYGNQIGLATGQVSELYHPGYVAKRMEVGAVVGATPASHVRREEPVAGDKIILLGGRTGRDGIGGATGSSKSQNVSSVEESGAEVQKGNAPVERKLQRLFRREDACRLIKRCNDFGAGGVSVATGEIAGGLDINLDAVPKKYEGLDGTELAISESQERMAVAVASSDVDEFLQYAREENLEAVVVADVTSVQRLRMRWQGDLIVDISREFLNTNGAKKHATVHVAQSDPVTRDIRSLTLNSDNRTDITLQQRLIRLVQDPNIASNKGLSERFDSTIGAASVFMPFGGAQQLTAPQAMVAKLPVFGETNTASAMAWGFNPYISELDQYTGAYLAVVESVAKLVASGFEHRKAYLSFQEYFGKLGTDPTRWGKPVASVLGALMAQADLGVAAIGGKDSMSGSFEDLDVPPTLISFAVAVGDARRAVSPELKAAGHRLLRIAPRKNAGSMIADKHNQLAAMSLVEELTTTGAAAAVITPSMGGVAQALVTMMLGNHIGIELNADIALDDLFALDYGSFIVELTDDAFVPNVSNSVEVGQIGVTTSEYAFVAGGERVSMDVVQEAWESAMEGVFPYRSMSDDRNRITHTVSGDFAGKRVQFMADPVASPRVIIPVFPGNNCEYDSAAAFERAGASVDTLVINNLTPADVSQSVRELAARIRESNIIMIPGGFSGGDEPDGSAKFITAFFRAPEVSDAVRDLLQNRDGLMLGICNGFQALIKLGLVPYGDIRDMDETCPTLTFNTIGRHQSRLVRTRVASTLSPWLSLSHVGDEHLIAISHGEGRFVASPEELALLESRGQIATQYVNDSGQASMDLADNPNGSLWAIEGITSPDGRVFGKMGHSERIGKYVYKNVPGVSMQPIFEAGVAYFKS